MGEKDYKWEWLEAEKRAEIVKAAITQVKLDMQMDPEGNTSDISRVDMISAEINSTKVKDNTMTYQLTQAQQIDQIITTPTVIKELLTCFKSTYQAFYKSITGKTLSQKELRGEFVTHLRRAISENGGQLAAALNTLRTDRGALYYLTNDLTTVENWESAGQYRKTWSTEQTVHVKVINTLLAQALSEVNEANFDTPESMNELQKQITSLNVINTQADDILRNLEALSSEVKIKMG